MWRADPTDSTIAALQKPAILFFTNVFTAARHVTRKYAMNGKNTSRNVLVFIGLPTDVGAETGTIFQEIRPDTGDKTSDFVREEFGRL